MRAGQTEEVTDSWPHAAPRSWMVSAARCQQAGALWRFVWRGKTRAGTEKGALFAFDGRWGATLGAGCGRSVHKVR